MRLTKSRSSVIIFLIIALCFILIQCIERGNKKNTNTVSENIGFDQFAGSQTCATCHKQIYDSFAYTGHFLTSESASEKNIKGSFDKGTNIFHYTPDLSVAMEKTDSGLYQVEYVNGVKTISRRFDVTIGSGTRGQTYLSWDNNLLNQLPVSYLTSANEWANSPGDQNNVYFDRPINSRCLECHTTYAEVLPFRLQGSPEEFDHKKIVYGISCEKCHGPGAKHVEFQTENPDVKTAKYIINPANFSRQQSLDLCSLCHGGRIKSTQPAFTFQSGDKLEKDFIVDTLNNGSIDVHGNQYGLLSKSKCFRTSSMTCLTCHSPHDDERGNIALYSQRCMACHNKEHGTFCKINADKVSNISSNCIDCHMPQQISKSIVLQLPDRKIPTAQLLRTHFITVYPDATKKFLSKKS
jgi:hypothetical protein